MSAAVAGNGASPMPNAQGELEATALVPAVEFAISEQEICDTKAKYAGLTADTKEGYEEVRLAIGHLRTTRTAIEARRKSLKAGAIEWGRRVDGAAKKLTALIEEIEQPLRLKKEAIDDAAEVARRAAEDAERVAAEAKAAEARAAEEARIAFERAKLEAQRVEFEEARRKADEERKVAETEARIERERLAAERKTFEDAQKADRERAEKEQRAAQAKIDADRAELEAQQRAIREKEEAVAREAKEREEAVRKEQEAKEQADLDRIAAEERDVADKARAEAEAARLEAMRPDIDRIRVWAAEIREFANKGPVLESDEAQAAINWAHGRFFAVAFELEKFKPKAGG